MSSLDVNVSPGASGASGGGDASLGGGPAAAAAGGAPPAAGGVADPFTSTVQNLGTASAQPAPASTPTPDTFATNVAAGGGWGGSSGAASSAATGVAAGGGWGNQGQFGSNHGDGQPDPKDDPRLQGGYGALAQPDPLGSTPSGPGDQFAPAPPMTNTQPPTDRAVDVNPVDPATALPSNPGGSTPG